MDMAVLSVPFLSPLVSLQVFFSNSELVFYTFDA